MLTSLEILEGDWLLLRDAASDIRRVVFIEEQHVSLEEEWDGRDAESHHFLALLEGRPVGTARLLPDAHIGRVAVLAEARGRGIGVALMQSAIATAQRHGHTTVELAAQTHALGFYESLGFRPVGDAFIEANILHRNMQLTLRS
ncbi:GNAT family N-acetyltransferase [Halomonas sp. TRM85114]|uniref:GNAT family N-acetyltransferase n=1 Tax=Halomonas jincaotanensis TaxID=2810616 RepID=UPI001BD6A9EB|nr:GNAT family N-acetyltransferase [Halomonas jincaotanensis]MBS9404450.1 GNAT family N-acetyltransferase [Halomonas jincaotanensis]